MNIEQSAAEAEYEAVIASANATLIGDMLSGMSWNNAYSKNQATINAAWDRLGNAICAVCEARITEAGN